MFIFEKCAYLKTQDELLQKIWDTSIYTLDLNRREFFLDGIKRDRWVWSGDATQAYLMNWYSFFDEDVARKTQVALAGKEEITQHLNTIVDYTLYWLISFRDHYRYTGDKRFITMWYDRFCQLADYVLSCADEKYRIQKRKKDWVFIDWGKGLTKDSDSYSFLQILLCHAMRGASEVAQIVGDAQNHARFAEIARSVYQDLQENYYDNEHGAFIYSIKGGKPDGVVLRQPNIMAIFYGVATKQHICGFMNYLLFVCWANTRWFMMKSKVIGAECLMKEQPVSGNFIDPRKKALSVMQCIIINTVKVCVMHGVRRRCGL